MTAGSILLVEDSADDAELTIRAFRNANARQEFDVLSRIRSDARTRFLPMVILTSSVEASDLRRGYQLGANSYVRKPVSFRDFLGTAQQIAAYWLTVNVVPPGGGEMADSRDA
jgi:DNA-binding NarL/FixJ family response regulator